MPHQALVGPAESGWRVASRRRALAFGAGWVQVKQLIKSLTTRTDITDFKMAQQALIQRLGEVAGQDKCANRPGVGG